MIRLSSVFGLSITIGSFKIQSSIMKEEQVSGRPFNGRFFLNEDIADASGRSRGEGFMMESVSKSVQPKTFHPIAEGDQRKTVSRFSEEGDVLGAMYQADFGSGFDEPDIGFLQHGMQQQAKVAETHVPSAAEGPQNPNLSGASLAYGIFEGKFQIGLVFFPWERKDFRSFIFSFPEPFRVDGIHVSNQDIGPSS